MVYSSWLRAKFSAVIRVSDLRRAMEILDADHYALTDVKDRVLEFLAVRRLHRQREVLEASAEESATKSSEELAEDEAQLPAPMVADEDVTKKAPITPLAFDKDRAVMQRVAVFDPILFLQLSIFSGHAGEESFEHGKRRLDAEFVAALFLRADYSSIKAFEHITLAFGQSAAGIVRQGRPKFINSIAFFLGVGDSLRIMIEQPLRFVSRFIRAEF